MSTGIYFEARNKMAYNNKTYLVALFLIAASYVTYRLQLEELRPSRYASMYVPNVTRSAFNAADGGGAFIQTHLGPMDRYEFAPIYYRRFSGN